MHRDQQSRLLTSKLRPLAVRNYAESRDWALVDGVQGRYWLLRHREHSLRQLQVPMDTEDPNFVDAMTDVVARIAELEGRALGVVLADLLSADADIIRTRLSLPEAEAGDVSLAADAGLRDGIRRALLAQACTVVNPAPFHPRMSRNEAEALLAACRVGQTEVGSYVVKIICPLHITPRGPELVDDVPFTRQVTTSLMEAVSALVDGIERDNVDKYLEKTAERPIISWNLCDALLRMQQDRGQIEISATWAADATVAPPRGVRSRVAIKAEYSPAIEEVARALRPPPPEPREELLIGTVETLNGTVGAGGRRSGEVLFSLLLPENSEPVRARAWLDFAQYEVAVRAHQKGRVYVRLIGVFHPGVRVSRIAPVRDFRELEEQGPQVP